MSNWTLFSNHGHVLFCLARDSEARLRDVAADVGITERAVQKIVRDLQDGGMISVTKNGRRNCYRIHKKQGLRHRLESDCKLRDLIKVVIKSAKPPVDSAVRLPESEHTSSSEPEPIAESDLRTPETEKVVPPEKPATSESKPLKTKPHKKTEPEQSKLTDRIEKQQGSLF